MWTSNSPRERELRGRGTRRLWLPMHGDSSAKLCECGCGNPAPISNTTDRKRGYIKGRPRRFILGHHMRGLKHSPQARQAMGESRRGRQTGEENPAWKGGITRERRRVCVRVGRDHPMADNNGNVLEHRLVMAAVLGRYLASSEIVHHINEDPFDNTPENLVVVSRGQHLAIHCLLNEGVDPYDAVRKVLS